MSENEVFPQNEAALDSDANAPAAFPEAVITLYQPLGPHGANGHALARRIWDLEAAGCQTLHLRINSAGGSVVHGYSLFSALRHTHMQVHTWLDGLALSMAGLLYLAGHVRHMAPWGLLMLHNPSLEGNDALEPQPEEEGSQELLGRIRASLLEMYADTTGLSPETLSGMMDAQTWLTATRCQELGLVHELTGQSQPSAERQLDLLTACTPVARLEPVALEALAACVERFADGGAIAGTTAVSAGFSLAAPPTFRDLERRHPEWLLHLRREDPSAFQALYDQQYR